MDRRVSGFLDDVAAWARAQADVRAFLLVGSQARLEMPAYALSDVDLALFVDDSQAQLVQLSNDFWYHLLWGARKLRRGELLLAKQVCDCYFTERIVDLLRWRAHGEDTWHRYRFFERWAGEATPDALRPTFAQYEAGDIGRALRAKGELFGQLEHELAQRFGLAEPVDRREIFRRLDELLAHDVA